MSNTTPQFYHVVPITAWQPGQKQQYSMESHLVTPRSLFVTSIVYVRVDLSEKMHTDISIFVASHYLSTGIIIACNRQCN